MALEERRWILNPTLPSSLCFPIADADTDITPDVAHRLEHLAQELEVPPLMEAFKCNGVTARPCAILVNCPDVSFKCPSVL
jgi:hypothetical protein